MWKRSDVNTTAAQGPSFDHTTYSSRGSYIYLSDSNGTVPNAPARFISPVIREAGTSCKFEFWIYVTGFSSNQFDVTLLTGNQIERATIQRFHYQSMTNWTKVTLEVGRIDVPFQLAFDSRRTTYLGRVAIDDTNIRNCQLPPIVNPSQCQGADQYLCSRGSCVKKNNLCDMTDDCGDQSDELSRLCSSYSICTFEGSFCDWRHDPTGQFKWDLVKGPTPSDETGVSCRC